MGEGSFGCQCTSAGDSGQSNGRWTTVPGIAASRRASSVARSTAHCVAVSFGWPSVQGTGSREAIAIIVFTIFAEAGFRYRNESMARIGGFKVGVFSTR